MADESELRGMLRQVADAGPAPELDTSRLVRRSRARRLPRQLAVGGVLSLAIVGLGVGTVSGARLLNPPAEVSSAGGGSDGTDEQAGTLSERPQTESEDSGDSSAGGGIQLAPAYKIHPCGGMLGVLPADGPTGVSVAVDFPDEASAAGTVRGTVEITNDTGEPLSGVMSDVAATTLSQDGVVLWHTPRLNRTLPVDLQPGQAITLDASFEPRVCSAEDEGRENFRSGLPTVEPGNYDVSVAFDIERENGFVLQVVSGTEPITLR